jgi:hypothetical protein
MAKKITEIDLAKLYEEYEEANMEEYLEELMRVK